MSVMNQAQPTGFWKILVAGIAAASANCGSPESTSDIESTCTAQTCGRAEPECDPNATGDYLEDGTYGCVCNWGYTGDGHVCVSHSPADPGKPACNGTFLEKAFYEICHHDSWLIPAWVGYLLTPLDLEGNTERTDDFRADEELPKGHRAELPDYAGSGYDRGHLAPAADFVRNRSAMSSTFVLSNMAPQTSSLNRGKWAQLEKVVRNKTLDSAATWIFSGNLFLNSAQKPTAPSEWIGPNNVAVPSDCFKVFLVEYAQQDPEAYAFVMPNTDSVQGDLQDYQVRVDKVEQMTGFDFFANLPDALEHVLEASLMPIE